MYPLVNDKFMLLVLVEVSVNGSGHFVIKKEFFLVLIVKKLGATVNRFRIKPPKLNCNLYTNEVGKLPPLSPTPHESAYNKNSRRRQLVDDGAT